jgi:hypothetical protein
MKMSPENEAYFFDLSMLFVQPGWHQFKNDFVAFYDALKESALGLKTLEDFHFARGRADAFNQILTYERMILESKKAIDEAPEPDAPLEE